MATTDTVLQPGSEDLSAFTGPAGPQGAAGPTGPAGIAANTNILSLLISMPFNGDDSSYTDSNTVITYLISGGTKFAANGSHVITTGPYTSNDSLRGGISGFLATSTDPYTVQLDRQKYVPTTGVVAVNQLISYDIEIYQCNVDEILWRIIDSNGFTKKLIQTGAQITTFEFSLQITA